MIITIRHLDYVIYGVNAAGWGIWKGIFWLWLSIHNRLIGSFEHFFKLLLISPKVTVYHSFLHCLLWVYFILNRLHRVNFNLPTTISWFGRVRLTYLELAYLTFSEVNVGPSPWLPAGLPVKFCFRCSLGVDGPFPQACSLQDSW